MDQDLLEAFFDDVNDLFEEWVGIALSLKPKNFLPGYTAILRCAHNLKGSAGLVGLTELHATMHSIEDYLVQLRDDGRAPDQEVINTLLETEKVLQRWVQGLKRNHQHVERTEFLLTMWSNVINKTNDMALTPEVPAEEIAMTKREDSLRISVSKLDRVIQLAGEISLHQAILERASREDTLNSPNTHSVIELTGKLTKDLQNAAMSLRMIPLDPLFQRIERVVRETASKLDRMVKFSRAGGEVTMDKIVVEGIFEPLIHLARNAVDHGIEPGEERISAGKEAEGSIHIEAESDASGVILSFADDGRGIDPEKVFNKAVQMGLVSADETISAEGKLQLIFLQGLSTAAKVTEFSGRGVGMDVVADSVKKLGGRIELQSSIGKGTRVIITLPTNISIVDALVVRVNGNQYAIPNQDLSEVIDLREFRLQELNGGEGRAIDLRGKVVPVAEMTNFLGEQRQSNLAPNIETPKPSIVIRHYDHWLAIAVESVIGQQRIFVRPVMEHLAQVQYFSGTTILSDGEPTIILNLPAMAQNYFKSH